MSSGAKYSVEALRRAINAVTSNKLSIKESSRKYSVPFSSLRKRIHDNECLVISPGAKTYLSAILENELHQYILGSAKRGI